MSVPKYKRNESKVEFIHNALKLRKYTVCKLLKDFGIKDKLRDNTYFLSSNKLEDSEKKQLGDLLRKCDYNAVLERYPDWFLRQERSYISDLCRNMVADIFHANNTYITCVADIEERRKYQNSAITNVILLLQEFTFLTDNLPQVNADALKPLIEMADREIALLKGWRKSDYQKRNALKAENGLRLEELLQCEQRAECELQQREQSEQLSPPI